MNKLIVECIKCVPIEEKHVKNCRDIQRGGFFFSDILICKQHLLHQLPVY